MRGDDSVLGKRRLRWWACSAGRSDKVHLSALQIARELRGLSQKQLGDRAEPRFSQAQISRLEKGNRVPRLDTVRRLADALDVDPDALFPRDDGKELRRALEEYFQDPHRETQPRNRKAKR